MEISLIRVISATIAIGLSANSSVSAQTINISLPEYYDAGNTRTESGRSGRTGGTEFDLSGGPNQPKFLRKIVSKQRRDSPCHLEAHYNSSDDSGESVESLTRCNNNVNRREGNVSSFKQARLPIGAFVTGIQVCLNPRRNKIKGIALFGNYGACLNGDQLTASPSSPKCRAKYFKDGGGVDRQVYCKDQSVPLNVRVCTPELRDWFTRTNCQASTPGTGGWEPRVNCPTGQVAVGMKASGRLASTSSGRQRLQSLELVCATITRNVN